MNASVRILVGLSLTLLVGGIASAQVSYSPAESVAYENCTSYRVVYRTVYDQKEITAYRIEQETVYDEKQVTRYRSVWETTMRERRYTVARPVTETSFREETYTVSRPVWETGEREEYYTVRRPVYETSYRTERYTVMRPVNTCRTEYVDQGQYAQQTVMKPGRPKNRLGWQAGVTVVNPTTGQSVYQRPGLYWTQNPAGRYEVKQVWQPHMVARQVPVTTYVPTVETREVPVQTCRYEEERMVRKVPYKVCRMVTEQRVRKIPVTTCRTVYEERVEQIPERTCRMVAYQETVRVPRCVERRVPITYTCNVPRVVCYRIPLDACGNPIETVLDSSVSVPAAPTAPTLAAEDQGTGSEADPQPELGKGEGAPAPVDGSQPPAEDTKLKRVPAPPAELTPSAGDPAV